jgi:hypothetical protein
MLRIKNLSNRYQKRLIRPLYAQTQATPYAAVLDGAFRDAAGGFVVQAGAFALKGGHVPGSVVTNVGEKVKIATGAANEQVFGLLANFIGGELDDLGDENYVGVWRGPDSVFELLAPAFDDTGLAAAFAGVVYGTKVPLYAQTDGRLGLAAGTSRQVVAHLIERVSASRIIVDLKV